MTAVTLPLSVFLLIVGGAFAFTAANWVYTWRANNTLHARISSLKEALAAYKLQVAKEYPSNSHLRDVETRLVKHLEKIEMKLDGLDREHNHGHAAE